MQRYDFIKINNGEFVANYKRVNKSIAIRNFEIFQCTNLREWYVLRIIEPTLSSLEEFQKRDSIVAYILNLTVNINKHNPLYAGYHIKLSGEIMLKRMVINVQITDNVCFAWSELPFYTRFKKQEQEFTLYIFNNNNNNNININKCAVFSDACTSVRTLN